MTDRFTHPCLGATPDAIRDAAAAVLAAQDAYRDAVNGLGHPGEPHDRLLAHPSAPYTSTVDDCAACGGAQYGTEHNLQHAYGALRRALGKEPKPWEA